MRRPHSLGRVTAQPCAEPCRLRRPLEAVSDGLACVRVACMCMYVHASHTCARMDTRLIALSPFGTARLTAGVVAAADATAIDRAPSAELSAEAAPSIVPFKPEQSDPFSAFG